MRVSVRVGRDGRVPDPPEGVLAQPPARCVRHGHDLVIRTVVVSVQHHIDFEVGASQAKEPRLCQPQGSARPKVYTHMDADIAVYREQQRNRTHRHGDGTDAWLDHVCTDRQAHRQDGKKVVATTSAATTTATTTTKADIWNGTIERTIVNVRFGLCRVPDFTRCCSWIFRISVSFGFGSVRYSKGICGIACMPYTYCLIQHCCVPFHPSSIRFGKTEDVPKESVCLSVMAE